MERSIRIGSLNGEMELKTALQVRAGGPSPRKQRGGLFEAGFTLIELMIVITIILILIGMAVGRYDRSVQKANEAVLRHNLQTIRTSIDNYTLDKQAAPQSLDDLVQAGYLRSVPTDPMTHAKDWVAQYDSVVLSPEQTTTGMTDVHSNSNRVSPFDQTPYNEW
jgi:general secretion pathway protein G